MRAEAPSPPSVLIVEGDPWVRDLLRETLLSVRCDAQVQLCADGSQALTALSSGPDLIIAARELGGVDGLELLRKVRLRSATQALPFILMSHRADSASVREALPLQPTEYLSKPVNLEKLRRRLEVLLAAEGELVCPVPPLRPGTLLPGYLEQRRTNAEGGALMVDVHRAVKRALDPQGLDLRMLEQEVRSDPQVTGVLIAAANSAAMHRLTPVQTLGQALAQLGSVQSMNLILGLTLKRSAQLSDPRLAAQAERFWRQALHTAEHARVLARRLKLDAERCYCAGLLHSLGDLAVLRCLEEWVQAGGTLSDAEVTEALGIWAAPFGSALRTRWRLPLGLRELIAAVYRLGGGVYGQEMLVMSLAGELGRLLGDQGLSRVADGKAARLLKLDLGALQRLYIPPTPDTHAPVASEQSGPPDEPEQVSPST